jgi:hypothetical protein
MALAGSEQPRGQSIVLHHPRRHSQDPAEISLVAGSGRQWITLVVVPPRTDPVVAPRAMTMAGLNGDQHRAHEILDLSHHPTVPSHAIKSACVDELAAAGWDSEGGRVVP